MLGVSQERIHQFNLAPVVDTLLPADPLVQTCPMAEEDEQQEDVVRHAMDQRPALEGEPECVICGRYGEYVCDATDEDVCSLECRDVCLARAQAAEQRKQQTNYERARAAQLRTRLNIRVREDGAQESGAPPPVVEFSECELPQQLWANMQRNQFERPTPVQMQMLPCALNGRHILVSAPTGTGKTAAFLIPIIAQILRKREEEEDEDDRALSVPLALILVPIRELAMQIETVAKLLMQGIAHMKTALLVGGMPMPPQLHRLQQGVQIIIATPGRLIDIGKKDSEALFLANISYCVIDEVDMMLDIGFHAQIAQIVGSLPPISAKLQMIFASATVSTDVENLVKRLLKDEQQPQTFVRIEVGGIESTPTSSSMSSGPLLSVNVKQQVMWVENKAKKQQLFKFLKEKQQEPTLVFVDSKVGADMLAEAISKACNVPVASIHAGKSQQDRLTVLESFVNQSVLVLVSTNVLSRGMDLLHVQNVVIFDFPKRVEDFIHLAGRTGRQGQDNAGSVLCMVNMDNRAVFSDLAHLLRRSKISIPRDIYRSLHSERRNAQAQAKVLVVNESKRAFRIREKVDNEIRVSAIEWKQWGKHQSKRQRTMTHM